MAATLALYPHIKAVISIGEDEDRGDAIAWKDFLNLSSDANPQQVVIIIIILVTITAIVLFRLERCIGIIASLDRLLTTIGKHR